MPYKFAIAKAKKKKHGVFGKILIKIRFFFVKFSLHALIHILFMHGIKEIVIICFDEMQGRI